MRDILEECACHNSFAKGNRNYVKSVTINLN